MSSQKKIVIKASAPKQMPAAAAAASAPAPKSKVVVKTSAPQRVVSAPAKKVVVRQIVEEVEEEEDGRSEALLEAPGPKTPQQIYDEIQVLLAQLVQVSGGKKKGFKKDGTPRAKRTNTSGWNAFVKEFREANPEVSWKDAMVLCKAEWAALKGEVAPEEEADESSVAAAPAPAPKPAAAPKKLVIPAKKTAAPAPPAKTAAELMAEAAAAAAAAEAEKAKLAEAEAPEVEVEEFEWEGQTLQKNAEGFCWRIDEEGEQIFVGRWDAEKEEMDEKAEEPTYGESA